MSARATISAPTAPAARPNWRAEIVATTQLAAPIVIANLGQIAINTTDVLLMGWLGPHALAAGALGTNTLFAIIVGALGIIIAVSPLAAHAIGARDTAAANRALHAGLWTSVILSVPAGALVWFSPDALAWLGEPPATVAMTREYLQALVWSLFPFLAFAALRAYIAAYQRPTAGTVVMLAGIALNAILAYGLMFGRWGMPELGLVGAGIATSVGNALMGLALAAFVVVDPQFRARRPFAGLWRFPAMQLRELLRVGGPIGGAMTLEVGIFAAAAMMMGLIGMAELAANQIALQMAAFTFMIPMGIGQAATVRVALAAGRGDARAAATAGWVAIALGVGVIAVAALAMWTWPERLVGLFVDPAHPDTAEVAALAVSFLVVAAAFQLVDATQGIAGGALRGLKDTRVPMAVAVFGYWIVGAPLGLVLAFPAGLRGIGIWIGLAVGLAVVAVLLLWRWQILSSRAIAAITSDSAAA